MIKEVMLCEGLPFNCKLNPIELNCLVMICTDEGLMVSVDYCMRYIFLISPPVLLCNNQFSFVSTAACIGDNLNATAHTFSN